MSKQATVVWSLVGLVAALGLAWWLQREPQKAAGPGPGSMSGTSTVGTAPGAGAAARPPGPGGPGGAGQPIPVEIGTAVAVRIEDAAEAVGSLRARQTVVVRPEQSGRITELGFADGAVVRRGQLLVQLDDTLQRAQLQQAEAQAAIALTQLKRSRELLAQNFISQSAVDQNQATLQVAEAQVALARAQLARLRVLSPFDGVAGIRSVNVGDYLKDGADVVTLEDRSTMWVDFRLPERHVARVRRNQPVQVTIDALPGRVYEARVEALDVQVSADGRSLLVRARIDRPTAELKTGLFARTRVLFAVREGAVMVPEEAVVPQGGKPYLVQVIDAPGGARQSRRIEAQLGARQPGRVEVLAGLKAGDVVVTAGHGRLMRADNLPLRIVDLDAPMPAAAGRPGAPGSGPSSAAGAGAVAGSGPQGAAKAP